MNPVITWLRTLFKISDFSRFTLNTLKLCHRHLITRYRSNNLTVECLKIRIIRENPRFAADSPKCDVHSDISQGHLVLRDKFTYVKGYSLWKPEFIRDSTLFPNKLGLPDLNYWKTEWLWTFLKIYCLKKSIMLQ